jgi:hypothetical protein
MTATVESIQSLYKRLLHVGFKRPYVRTFGFPDWWDDKYASDEGTFYEAKLTLARRLGLDLGSVLSDVQPISFRNIGACRFKTRINDKAYQQTPAQALARSLAEIAAAAVELPYHPLPASGLNIREDILAQGRPWISFEDLLSYLWGRGIPVLFLSSPPSPVGMEGMVTMVNNRPVIILTKKEKHSAWLLFILAHEVGHIALGHVKGNETLADKKISKNDQDPDEKEANHCAVEIITADGNTQFVSSNGRWLNAEKLAHAAIQYGRDHHIDPGHIALNYGNANRQMGTARDALNIIEQASPCAQSILFRYIVENISPDRLPDDSYDFLMRMCGNPVPEQSVS